MVFVMNLSSAVPVCGIFRMYTVYDASDTKGVFGNFEAETVKCYTVCLYDSEIHTDSPKVHNETLVSRQMIMF